MKESLIISILVIFIYIFLFSNKNNLILIKSDKSVKQFLVTNDCLKKESAKLLDEIIDRMYRLKDHLIKIIDTVSDDKLKDSIRLLGKNLKSSRTKIYENPPNSNYTSYSVNKGEEVVFCLKSKKKKNTLHKIDLLMYVAIHEMAHIGCHEIGHTELFKKIFEFYVKESINIGIYKYEDYDSNPVEYCGMILSSNIV